MASPGNQHCANYIGTLSCVMKADSDQCFSVTNNAKCLALNMSKCHTHTITMSAMHKRIYITQSSQDFQALILGLRPTLC